MSQTQTQQKGWIFQLQNVRDWPKIQSFDFARNNPTFYFGSTWTHFLLFPSPPPPNLILPTKLHTCPSLPGSPEHCTFISLPKQRLDLFFSSSPLCLKQWVNSSFWRRTASSSDILVERDLSRREKPLSRDKQSLTKGELSYSLC